MRKNPVRQAVQKSAVWEQAEHLSEQGAHLLWLKSEKNPAGQVRPQVSRWKTNPCLQDVHWESRAPKQRSHFWLQTTHRPVAWSPKKPSGQAETHFVSKRKNPGAQVWQRAGEEQVAHSRGHCWQETLVVEAKKPAGQVAWQDLEDSR